MTDCFDSPVIVSKSNLKGGHFPENVVNEKCRVPAGMPSDFEFFVSLDLDVPMADQMPPMPDEALVRMTAGKIAAIEHGIDNSQTRGMYAYEQFDDALEWPSLESDDSWPCMGMVRKRVYPMYSEIQYLFELQEFGDGLPGIETDLITVEELSLLSQHAWRLHQEREMKRAAMDDDRLAESGLPAPGL